MDTECRRHCRYRQLTKTTSMVDVTGVVGSLTIESGELRWENKTMTYRGLSAPVIMPGTVAVGDNEGYVHLLSPRTGEEIARTV